VLVGGGARDGDCCWTEDSYAREIEVYDPATGLWYTIEELPQAGVYSAGVLLPDGRLLITGGETGEYGTIFLSELWFYPPLSTQPSPLKYYQEHNETLRTWLPEQGNPKFGG